MRFFSRSFDTALSVAFGVRLSSTDISLTVKVLAVPSR